MKDGIGSFRGEIFRISTFTIGEPGEPYCTILDECIKLRNKFLGTTINNSKIEFCKDEDYFLFSVDKEYYRMDIRLSTKVSVGPRSPEACLHNILLLIILRNRFLNC